MLTPLMTYTAVGIGLSVLFYLVNVTTYYVNRDHESRGQLLKTYECGFEALPNQSRQQHSIGYYVVALLYVVFDLEVALMLPAIVSLTYIGVVGSILLLLVLTLLCYCFVYELKLGVFDAIIAQPASTHSLPRTD